MRAYWVDIAAVAFFVRGMAAYGFTLEHTAYGRDSLSARMHRYREVWSPEHAAPRDAHGRHADHGQLQNGTAFFASTSLIAIGGGLALLRATNDALDRAARVADRPHRPRPRCGKSNASA